MLTEDIPVKYVNATKKTDVQVVVFSKNSSLTTPSTCYVAWHILRGQGGVQFTYPASIEIGASYKTGGMTITAGPINSEQGSTWEIKQETLHETATLTKRTGILANPNGAIVVKNMAPNTWCGRKFDIGVYKDKHLIVMEREVRVGTQIDFLLEPKLYFGVVCNMKIGNVFDSLQATTSLTEFDLKEYPFGIEVTLNEMPGGGQFKFTAELMM